jgi:hypothetical protein
LSPLQRLEDIAPMQIVICTLISAVVASFLAILSLILKPQESNGFISQGGATIFIFAGVFLCVFAVSWFPSLIIGYFVMRKGLSKQQKAVHIAFTLVSGIVFFVTLSFVGNVLMHHS